MVKLQLDLKELVESNSMKISREKNEKEKKEIENDYTSISGRFILYLFLVTHIIP